MGLLIYAIFQWEAVNKIRMDRIYILLEKKNLSFGISFIHKNLLTFGFSSGGYSLQHTYL